MLLYVIRHAAAAEREPGMFDHERPLTEEGAARIKKVAMALRRADITPAAIHTSPALRARQTAEVVAAALDLSRALHDCDALLPGRDPAGLLDFVASCRRQDVALVGHEPQLGEFVGMCVTGKACIAVDVKKSSVCCLKFDGKPSPGRAIVLWHLVPSIVEKLTS